MQYVKYSIQCVFQESGSINSFQGSSLRGAFGHALKKAVCTVQKKSCDVCLLKKQCLFTRLFPVAENTDGNLLSKKIPTIPPPYVIEPIFESKTHYQVGEKFAFNLILFGEIIDFLPFFIYAFELMSNQGIGKKLADNLSQEEKNKKYNTHINFAIEDILTCHDNSMQSIYNAIDQQLFTSSPSCHLDYKSQSQNIKNSDASSCVLTLQIHTPLRFKHNNHLSSDLSFEQLFKLAIRRITDLFSAYGASQLIGNDETLYKQRPRLDIDFLTLLELAREVKIIDSNLQWEEQTRYSNRQKAKLQMGGILGSISYEGNIMPFIPFLELATLLHLGKQTTFGLGRITYTLTQS